MHDVLNKRRFINALVREHLAIERVRQIHSQETKAEYLRLEVIPSGSKAVPTNQLVIRGNRLGTVWMIWDQEFPNTNTGMCDIQKAAVEIAFAAARTASEKLGLPVQFGMPPVTYYGAWLQM